MLMSQCRMLSACRCSSADAICNAVASTTAMSTPRKEFDSWKNQPLAIAACATTVLSTTTAVERAWLIFVYQYVQQSLLVALTDNAMPLPDSVSMAADA